MDIVYIGQPPPETLIELVDQLRELPGVHRLTSVAANVNGSTRSAA
ncbi:MAG TPA: hypothetical protein VGJ60_09690 [Chloroflexota bacterium]|jgi:hypothetical protein